MTVAHPDDRADADADRAPRRATLCVTTYQRPFGLARTLSAIGDLRTPPHWQLDVVVVDNDPEGSGRAVVAGTGHRYVVEPARGIPNARNCAVAQAAESDWLLFLDDDQVPEADWLEHLEVALQAAEVDVLVGPCLADFEVEPPAWIRRGRFFERLGPPAPTVTLPYWHARTGGVLIRTASFAHLGAAPFDVRLALSGGSDRTFFAELAKSGARIAWAPDAIVTESIPATRANLSWLLKRSFRIGTVRSHTLLHVDRGGVLRRVLRVARGAVEVVRGLAAALIGPRMEDRARGLQRATCGVGLSLGAVGYRYGEYKTTHGS